MFTTITYELITNFNCNLGCYFCFAHKKSNETIFKTILCEKIIDFISYHTSLINDKMVTLKIYGGEPMLYHSHLSDFIDKCLTNKNISWSFNIITNGTVLPNSFCYKINEWRSSSTVSITFSMEGDEYLHNRIRHYTNNNSGSFSSLLLSIRKYRKICDQHRAHIQTVLSPDLLENIDSFIEHMEKYKNELLFDLVPMFDKTFSNYDVKKSESQMTKLFNYYTNKFIQNDAEHIGIFQSQRSLCNLFSSNQKSHCGAGVNMICILPTGDVTPCSKFYHNDLIYDSLCSYGNLITDNADDIVNNIISHCNVYRELTLHDIECETCQNTNVFGCTGQCLAETLMGGKYKWVCDYNKIFGTLSHDLILKCCSYDSFINKFSHFQTINYPDFHTKFIEWLKKGGDIIDKSLSKCN